MQRKYTECYENPNAHFYKTVSTLVFGRSLRVFDAGERW